MKLQCTFCKSTDPDMIPFRMDDKVFCSATCLNRHRSMVVMHKHKGFLACIFHGIMVINKCIHKLIKYFQSFSRR
jgi:hypothetical protein